jgi:adenylosuccinate lyase
MRAATARARKEKLSLAQVLKQSPEVTTLLSELQIDELLDPRGYLGSAERFIARVVGEADAEV